MKNLKDALEMMTEAAKEPSLDELAKRARAVLAMQAPSDSDMLVLAEHWRRQRSSWGTGAVKVEDEDA